MYISSKLQLLLTLDFRLISITKLKTKKKYFDSLYYFEKKKNPVVQPLYLST